LGATESRAATVVIGAGPAGLTAAYELTRAGWPVTVLEQDPQHVGGLSRTIEHRGFRFDIGGHRFFSKNQEIEDLWTEVLGEQMRRRKRLSRIYYRGRFFKYPLEPLDALRNLGAIEALACILSYGRARWGAPASVRSFEDWVVAAFGRRLYEIFFRTYTEKVWGIPCADISADWATQRIRGLSVGSLIRSAVGRGNGENGALVKTLAESFRYPPHGPGELWEAVARRVRERGGRILLGESVVGVTRSAHGVESVLTCAAEGEHVHAADAFVSTMSIRDVVASLDPSAPDDVVAAARELQYRDFITVMMVLDASDVFPDQWIYVHDPKVFVGRIQNFKNWSPEMVPDPRFTVLGLEYFCSDGDHLWARTDAELVELGARELAALGLDRSGPVVDATVVRQRRAYPVYDHRYRENVERVRRFLEAAAPNLHLAGRNGMHKYNNQDHAMMTGLIAARNIMGDELDAWRVNADAEYLETAAGAHESRLVPTAMTSPSNRPPRTAPLPLPVVLPEAGDGIE
jgi:protoporphyrinogen oxidase